MNTFDLQIQTTASDGKHPPASVVKMAQERGLQVVAITDHDTTGGVQEALRAGGEFGVRVIPGIEISVKDRGAHILGFGVDYENPEILRYSEEAKRNRNEGAKKMAENMKNDGWIVDWEDIKKQASGGIVARPHIAKAVLSRPENKEKIGGAETVHDFIEKFLSNESPYYVKRQEISAKDAIDLIHGVGGVAIWSHPAIHFRGRAERFYDGATGYENLEKFLDELRGWGIEGIEVFTPSHTEDDVEFLLGLAAKYDLLKTAGSDFHEEGMSKKAVAVDGGVQSLHSAEHVGDYPTYGFSTEDILSKLDEAMHRRKEV